MATKRELTPAQESTWAALERMGLNPEDYYDFDADEIIDFPPLPGDLREKLTKIRCGTRQTLDRLERRLDD